MSLEQTDWSPIKGPENPIQDGFADESARAVADHNHDDTTTGILYEFVIHAEWPQEPELQHVKGYPANNDEVQSKRGASLLKTTESWLPLLGSSSIPDSFARLIDGHLNWSFSVGGDGEVIAILQDHLLEIRSSKDEFATVVGKCSVGKDLHPQWRQLAWSPDCSILAVSHSDGSIDFFDALASKLFTIGSPATATDRDSLADSLNSILFIEMRLPSNTNWSYEVLLIDYRGNLRSYYISFSNGYELSHTFSLSRSCRFIKSSGGVTSVVYDAISNLLVVGGPSVPPEFDLTSSPPYATELGIVAFRLLNDAPYYRLSLTFDEEKSLARSGSLFQWIPSFIWKTKTSDTIYRLCISPDSTLLAAVHASGFISLWNFPSLRFRKMFLLEEQPHYDDTNPVFAHNLKKVAAHDPFKHLVADINWWSEKALIVSRCSGALTVSSVTNFENLLGNSAEWFEGFPQVSMAHNRGFLVMECENRWDSKRRSNSIDDQKESDEDDEDDANEDDAYDSVVRRSINMMRTAIYFVTDSERFQPPRRKPRFLTRTYRLLCLKATSPESLFARKLDNEEYGEALALAQLYNLECDLVYQRQWRNAEVSIASIQDYLSKITKRSWVLHECLDRVPETLTANRALLEYGLRGTDLEALIAIGEGTDEGRFIFCESQSALCTESVDEFDTAAQAQKEMQEQQVRAQMILKVNFKKLTLDQKQLCFTRQKLIKYLERLNTYESMLGGVQFAPENFDAKFFRQFRAQPAPVAAIEFARQFNWRFVAAMFTYHGKETLPHRLAILSNFPETMSPMVYRSLLPEAMVSWADENSVESDWVEWMECRNGLGQTAANDAEFIYEEDPELSRFHLNVLEPQHLTAWYSWRANTIERRSRLVDHALELVGLGIERNVQGLRELYDDLVTLEVLVYECFIDDSLSLEHLQSMDDIDKLRLIMSRSSAENFVKNIRKWLIPFLHRCDLNSPSTGQKLMRQYLLSLAKHDLLLCAKVFDQSRILQKDPIICSPSQMIDLALDCIYECEENDQLVNVKAIFECLPAIRSDAYQQLANSTQTRIESLEKHLAAADILNNHNIPISIASIGRCEKNADAAEKLVILLTRSASRKNSEVSESYWRGLLEDVLDLQKVVMHCLEAKTCLKIFIQSMLCSGGKENIRLAGEFITSNKPPIRDPRIPGNSGSSRVGSGGVFRGIGRTSPPRISPKEASVLVISAAVEYFNSASDSEDPCMELAKDCLHLVKEADEDIEAEINLIDALPILSEFGMKLLPLQVRLCENRLHLIEQVLSLKPSAYKNSQKLMKLAHLMRVGQDVQLWGGKIQTLVASAAFEEQDYIACYQACQYIVLNKYAEGWQVCFALGKCDNFADIRARRELLAFCAVYCSGERLEEVVHTRHKLEVHLLQLKFHSVVSEFRGESGHDSNEQHLINQWNTRFLSQVQQLSTSITKPIFSIVGKSDFLENSMSWVHSKVVQPQNSRWNRNVENFDSNTDFERIGVPAFYASLLNNSFESPLTPSYTVYTMPMVEPNSALSLGILLLRLALLQESMLDKDLQENKAEDEAEQAQLRESCSNFTSKIFSQIASNLLPIDTLLGFAHLITIDDPDVTENCFERFPNTGICLQLAILAVSIQICREAKLIERSKLYSSSPMEMIRLAVHHAKEYRKNIKSVGNPNPKLEKYVELLFGYKKKLADLVQGNVLRSLGRGVDVVRFSEDDQYKREIVLGLAKTTDEKTYKMAISLATRYHIPLWDLYMAHFEYLFCDCDLSASEIQKRLTSLEIFPLLLNEPLKLRDRLRNVVSIKIASKDHPRFLYYLNLLAQCLNKEEAKHVQSVSRLLTKLQSIVPGIDFYKLVYGSESLLELFEPVVNGSNLNAVLKTLPTIKSLLQKSVKPNELRLAMLKKAFFEFDPSNEGDEEIQDVDRKPSLSKKKTIRAWLGRYEACKQHFEQLEPMDIVQFVRATIFSEKALDDIAVATRNQMLSRTLKYVRCELEKNKEGPFRESWNKALEELVKSHRHLEWMNSELVEETRRNADSSNILRFIREFELGGPESANAVIFDCIIDGQSVETLQRLVAIFPADNGCDSTPGQIISETINTLQNVVRNIEDNRSGWLAHRNPIDALQGVVDAILTHVAQGGDLIDLNDVIEQLFPICTDDSVDISSRLIVIKIIEKACPKDSSHLSTISACKMRAIITNTWPHVQVAPEELSHDEGKQTLFRNILDECKSLNDFDTLVQLVIDLLPLSSSNSCFYEENCWCQIMASILSTEDSTKCYSVINVLRQAKRFVEINLECLNPIMEQLTKNGRFYDRLKFALLTEHESLHTLVFEDAAKLDQNEIADLDAELCTLLLEHNMVPRTVVTGLYRPLVDYIQAELNFDEVKRIVGQLKTAGHYSEAASLLVNSSGLPAGLQTFNSAIGLLRRWQF